MRYYIYTNKTNPRTNEDDNKQHCGDDDHDSIGVERIRIIWI